MADRPTNLPKERRRPTATWTSVDISHLVNTFATEIQSTLDESERKDAEDLWQKWIRLYGGKPHVAEKTHPWPRASNTVINLSAIYVDQIAAKIMQGISAEPYWIVSEVNRSAADAAKPTERYLDLARQRFWNQYKVQKQMVLECLKLGTGVITTGWVDEPVLQFDPRAKKHIEIGRFVGPRPAWCPREDFLIPPGYSDPQTAPWIAFRQWFSKQELRRLEHLGQVENIDDLKGPGDRETELRRLRRHEESGGGLDAASARSDEFALWACWQIWFAWDLDEDGYAEEHVMLLHPEKRTLLRLLEHGNPYPRGMRPVVHAPFIEVEGRFDGIGIPEMVEYYQEEVTTAHNQRVDNHHLSNTPMVAVRKGAGITDRQHFFTGRLWLMTDPKQDIQPFQIGHINPFSVQEEAATIGLAERRVGISDPNLGQVTSPMGRAAASTMMGVMQEGARRHDLATSEIRRALTEHGYQICEMYHTHGLPPPGTSGSPEQILDEQDAGPVRELFARQDPIRGLVALQLNVATAALNRETEKQSSIQLLQLVTQYFTGAVQTWQQIGQALLDPNTPPPLKEALLSMLKGVDRAMQGVLQAHQRYDLEDILIADIVAGLAMQPNTGMGMPDGSAAQPAGGLGAAPPLGGGGNGYGPGPNPNQ